MPGAKRAVKRRKIIARHGGGGAEGTGSSLMDKHPLWDQLSAAGQVSLSSSSRDSNCDAHLMLSAPSPPTLSDHPSYCPRLCPFMSPGPLSAQPLQSGAATWGHCDPIISQGSCSSKQAPEIRSWPRGVLPGGGGPGGGPPSLLRWPDDA